MLVNLFSFTLPKKKHLYVKEDNKLENNMGESAKEQNEFLRTNNSSHAKLSWLLSFVDSHNCPMMFETANCKYEQQAEEQLFSIVCICFCFGEKYHVCFFLTMKPFVSAFRRNFAANKEFSFVAMASD